MLSSVSVHEDCVQRIDDFSRYVSQVDDLQESEEFHRRLRQIDDLSRRMPDEERNQLIKYCMDTTEPEFSASRVISHGRNKPFGYSGDFQIIDWTYTRDTGSPKRRGRFWDGFYHHQIAPKAVCARKDRFGLELAAVAARSKTRIRVLNVGSGPAREIKDGISQAGLAAEDVEVVCVDTDKQAIEYARSLLGPRLERSVHFHHGNALRYRAAGKFDLIWSAGLFDYLDARLSAFLLHRLWHHVAAQGRIVVGNFADTHRTRPWIEWCGGWFLKHRTLDDLKSLVSNAGVPADCSDFSLDQYEAIRFVRIVR